MGRSVDCTVPPPQPSRHQLVVSAAKTFILFILVSLLVAFAGIRLSPSLQGTDFVDFYAAARMVAEGHAHQLYDANVQRQYQARDASRVGTLYIHPPFEAAIYLAVAWLPLKSAYLLWSAFSLGFLALAARLLAKEARPPWDWRICFAASLTFVPVLLCLVQGQDSLLLLLLIVFAFTSLRRDHGFPAGCWLALALFKFQIIVPLTLVLAVTQEKTVRRALLKGFGLVALALAILSAAISGRSVFVVYPSFLLHLPEQAFAGIFPQAMANFRGFIHLIFHGQRSPWTVAAMAVLFAVALLKTLAAGKRASIVSRSHSASRLDFDAAFGGTVMFALLVSYHLNPHDLSLLLLPISLLMHSVWLPTQRPRRFTNWVILSLLVILFLPLLHLWALEAHAYDWISVPLVLLFLTNGRAARPDQAQAATLR
ncbi:MAG: glycosyltransferase family 87 protein [Candidatus Sulfotelmatobacter sp.]